MYDIVHDSYVRCTENGPCCFISIMTSNCFVIIIALKHYGHEDHRHSNYRTKKMLHEVEVRPLQTR